MHIVAVSCHCLCGATYDVLELTISNDFQHLATIFQACHLDYLPLAYAFPVQVIEPTGCCRLQHPDCSCLGNTLIYISQGQDVDHLICPLDDLVALFKLGYVLELLGDEGLSNLLTGPSTNSGHL